MAGTQQLPRIEELASVDRFIPLLAEDQLRGHMASSSKQQQRKKQEEDEEEESAWTKEENKRFEMALARSDEDDPDRWAHVARAVGGGKTADQVKRHYDHLAKDISLIDSAEKPFYSYPAGSRRGGDGDQDQRLRLMKQQNPTTPKQNK